MSTQYDLSPSSALFIPTSANRATPILLERFTIRTSCQIRMTNVTANIVDEIWIWAVYDSKAPGGKDILLAEFSLPAFTSCAIEAGPFNFAEGGSIHARAKTGDAVAMHITKVQY